MVGDKAQKLGVAVGDRVTIPTPKGDVDFIVAGIGGGGFPMAILPFAAGERYFDAAAIAAVFGFLLLGLLALLFLPHGYESMGQPVNDLLWREAYCPALRDMGIATAVSLILAPFIARLAAALSVVEATRGERLTLRRSADR